MKVDKRTFLLAAVGSVAGLINGFFGGGGGTVVVPLLISACGFLRKNAHATALSVMLPTCLVSAIVYAVNGNFDFKVILPVTVGFTLGGVLGAFLLSKLKENWIKYVFCAILIFAGIKLAFFS